MSLINEALKKAQHLQTRPTAAAPAQAPAAAPRLRTKPAQIVPPPIVAAPPGYAPMPSRPRGNSKLVLAVAGGVFLAAIGTLGLAAYLVFGRSAQAAVAPAETPAEEVAATTAPPPAPVQVVEAAPQPPAAPATPPPPPKRINRPNAVIQDFVNRMQVSGIRAGARPKALINDRVYAVGELVSVELELRLSSISAHTLGFEDAGGNTYELQF